MTLYRSIRNAALLARGLLTMAACSDDDNIYIDELFGLADCR